MAIHPLHHAQSPAFMRTIRVAAIAVSVTALFSYLDLVPHALGFVEQYAYSGLLEVAGRCFPEYGQRASSEIALVTITDQTYAGQAANGEDSSRLSRRNETALIDTLTRDHAAAIVFDVCPNVHEKGDADLAAAIKAAGKVVFASVDDDRDHSKQVLPLSSLIAAHCHYGFTHAYYSMDQPQVIDMESVIFSSRQFIPALSVEAVRLDKGLNGAPFSRDWHHPVRDMNILTDYTGLRTAFRIRYLYNPYGTWFLDQSRPVEDVLNKKFDKANRSWFKGKIVLIGSVSGTDHDIVPTPLGVTYGVLVHANAIATLLDGHYIIEAPPPVQIVVTALLVVITALVTAFSSLRRLWAVVVLILPLYLLAAVVVFVDFNYYLHLVPTTGAILLSGTWILLERGLTEENEKSNFKYLLKRYLNPQIADHIVQHPNLIGGEGRREKGTVLFADIRDFTKLSEELEPEELVARMNEYFQVITEIVFKYNGTVVNFVGDGMLAVFGLPITSTDHADSAVTAANEIRSAASVLRHRWAKEGQEPFSTGIGINTGEMIFGEIGGKELRTFTVYGLQVNIASRVEELNKELSSTILITENTRAALRKKTKMEGPITVQVKGVAAPVSVYKL
jgi:class 3 adenylate cyclase/CHASE2 domain-containing sensor protein